MHNEHSATENRIKIIERRFFVVETQCLANALNRCVFEKHKHMHRINVYMHASMAGCIV